MRARLLASAAAALSAATVVHPAVAQPTTAPLTYCVPGVAFACFAAAFETSNNTFSVWFQNLQGTASPDATSFNMFGFMLARRVDDREWALSPPTATTVGDVGGGGVVRTFDDRPATGEINGVQVINQWPTIAGTRFWGCTVPAPLDDPDSHVSTCPSGGLDGWVRYTFSGFLRNADTGLKAGDVTQRDLILVLQGRTGLEATPFDCAIVGEASGLTSALNPAVPSCTALPYGTVVPEPETLALTAGGLLVLSGMAMRRRTRRS